MANNSLDERLATLYQKRDHIDQFYDADLKTIIDAIRDAREHGGTASVVITPLVGGGGYKITITDSEGIAHDVEVRDGESYSTGYYYGQFNDVSSLPDASTLENKGYAYVASTDPAVYYIYLFEGIGSNWENSGNKFVTTKLETDLATKSQTKAPTTKAVAEGIETVNLLDTKSTPLTVTQKYNASANINDRGADVVPVTGAVNALGYKVLSPNLTFAEQVTADNTIYEIKDGFDLGRVEKTVNCSEKFNFGTINLTLTSAISLAEGDKLIYDSKVLLLEKIGNDYFVIQNANEEVTQLSYTADSVKSVYLAQRWVQASVHYAVNMDTLPDLTDYHYYGTFNNASGLPASPAEGVGYAYVKIDMSTNTIYIYNGEEWQDSNVKRAVTELITQKQAATPLYYGVNITLQAGKTIRIKSNQYLFNKERTTVLQCGGLYTATTDVELCLATTYGGNAKYFEATTVVVGNNSTLKFNGGSLSNGIIKGTQLNIETDKKSFKQVTIDPTSSFSFMTLPLSWFATSGEEVADIVEDLLQLYIGELYLDIPLCYIQHPIAIIKPVETNINTIAYRLRKTVNGLLGGLKNSNTTTISPNNTYSSLGYERNSCFLIDLKFPCDTTFKNIKFDGLTYKVGYGIYIKNYFTKSIENCSFAHLYLSGIKISGSERPYFEGNNFEYCGTMTLIYPDGINEDNILSSYTGVNIEGGPANLVYYIRNYGVCCNYGLVGQIGSDCLIQQCGISYTSRYAIYLNGYRNFNIFYNYFEGCGGSNFWIQKGEIIGAVGESGGEFIGEDWGFQLQYTSSTGYALVKPIIAIQSSQGAHLNSGGNNFSCNLCRSKSEDDALSFDKTKLGIDCIYALYKVKAVMGLDKVGSGSGIYSGFPRYFLACGMVTNTFSSGYLTDNIIDVDIPQLPEGIKNKDWLLYHSAGNIEGYGTMKVKYGNADKKYVPYSTKAAVMAVTVGSITDADIKYIQHITPVVLSEDGINYRNLVSSNGSYTLTYFVEESGAAVNKSNPLTWYQFLIKNNGNNAVTFYIKNAVRYGNTIFWLTDTTGLSHKLGDSNNKLTIQSKETKVVTFGFPNFLLNKITPYVKQVCMTVVSDGNLLVSDIIKSSVNTNIPALINTYPDGYSAVGKIIGEDAEYPTDLTSYNAGYMYYDKSLGKPSFWNGNYWTDANGKAIGLQVSDISVLVGAAANSTTVVDIYYAGTTPPTISILNSDDTPCTWLTGTPDPFTGNTLTLTATANTDSDPRGCKVVITLGSEEKIVNVVQSYSTT